MTYSDFNAKFRTQVEAVSYRRGLLLAIDICKKLFFDYQIFSQENHWGDPDLLLDAINLIQHSSEQTMNEAEVKSLISRIEEITPDSENFQNSNYALNACTSVLDTLDYLIDKDPLHLINVGTYLTDTVDSKSQESNELNQQTIDVHPLMIQTREYLINETK